MATNNDVPQKLYLLQLSTSAVPVAPGRTLEMVLGCYLIETTEGHHILIDTGFPPDVPKPANIPPARNAKNVLEHLADLKLTADDIDVVVCTHFDVDHAGYHDSFPKSKFLVQREHYELARSGHPRFAAARPHWDHPNLNYRLLDGDTQLLAGLRLLETSGHVPGHQSVLVRLPESGSVLLAIDAVMMKSMFNPERKISPLDDNEKQLRASTHKLLDVVEHEKVGLVVFGHDGVQWQTLKRAPAFYS
jgi:N-acyl homoserine lactone hydrolase